MLIKIMSYSKDNGISWWMYDANKVHFGNASEKRIVHVIDSKYKEPGYYMRTYNSTSVGHPILDDYNSFDPEITITDCESEVELECDDVNGKYRFVHWICFRDKNDNDNEKFLVFDNYGYICNDNGKTIEVIR